MTNQYLTQISNNIKQFMTLHGITVRQATATSGLSVGAVSNIRNGKDHNLLNIIILAEAIGMTHQQVFSHEFSPKEIDILRKIKRLTKEQQNHLSSFLSVIPPSK